MDNFDEEALSALVDKLRTQVESVLARPDATLPTQFAANLFDFSVTAQVDARYAQASETARSLASLLHGWGNRAPSEQERVQVTVLSETLLQELSPVPVSPVETHRPLVQPIAPSLATGNPRIALYVDNAALLVMLRETLGSAGFEPVVIDSLEVLAAVGDNDHPAAIVAEISMCRLHPDAGDVFANLRDRFVPPPHLICLASVNDIPARLEAVRLGATRFLGLPVDISRLISILKGVTVQAPAQPFRVVVVDDDPFIAEVCRDGLEDAGVRTLVVSDPMLAPAAIKEFQPDLVICDIFMPVCNGLELLALLRQDDDLVETPIVLLSSDPDIGRRLEALNLGADDFLLKPVDMDLMVAAVTARARRARTLRRSRGEYRRLQERVRELEGLLSGLQSGSDADFDTHGETISMDDYIVGELRHGEQ